MQYLITLAIMFLLVSCGAQTTNPLQPTDSTNSTPSAQKSDPAADAVAQRGLSMVEHIGSDYHNYGFRSQAELNQVVLGTPYQVLILEPQAVARYQAAQRISDSGTLKQWWEYPVLANGESRGMLTVVQQNNVWQTVGFGALTTGQRIGAFQALLAHNHDAPAIKLLEIPQIGAVFALIERDGHESLVYIISAGGTFLDLDQASLAEYTPEFIMPRIKRELDGMR